MLARALALSRGFCCCAVVENLTLFAPRGVPAPTRTPSCPREENHHPWAFGLKSGVSGCSRLEPRWYLIRVKRLRCFSLSVRVLDDMATRGKWWMAVATIGFFLLEWWSPQVQQYSAKEWEARKSGNWSERTCTNCQTVGWSGQKKKCRHCGVKKSNAGAPSTHRVHSGSGWTQAKPGGTSQVSRAATTSRGAAAICLWIRSSTHGAAPLDKPSASSSGPVELTKQIKHVEREVSAIWTLMCLRQRRRGNCWNNSSQS